MSVTLQPEAPPLREDGSGALRVGQSRVLVDLIIRGFQDGATPETLFQRYPTATLADIYAVIAYYLRHTEEVEAYLVAQEHRSKDIQQKIEKQQGNLAGVRDRLLKRQRND